MSEFEALLGLVPQDDSEAYLRTLAGKLRGKERFGQMLALSPNERLNALGTGKMAQATNMAKTIGQDVYKRQRDAVGDEQWQTNFDEQVRQSDRSHALSAARDAEARRRNRVQEQQWNTTRQDNLGNTAFSRWKTVEEMRRNEAQRLREERTAEAARLREEQAAKDALQREGVNEMERIIREHNAANDAARLAAEKEQYTRERNTIRDTSQANRDAAALTRAETAKLRQEAAQNGLKDLQNVVGPDGVPRIMGVKNGEFVTVAENASLASPGNALNKANRFKTTSVKTISGVPMFRTSDRETGEEYYTSPQVPGRIEPEQFQAMEKDAAITKARNSYTKSFEASRGKAISKRIDEFDAGMKEQRDIINAYTEIMAGLRSGTADVGFLAKQFPSLLADTLSVESAAKKLGLMYVAAAKLAPTSDTDVAIGMDIARPVNMGEKDLWYWAKHQLSAAEHELALQGIIRDALRSSNGRAEISGTPENQALAERVQDLESRFKYGFDIRTARGDDVVGKVPGMTQELWDSWSVPEQQRFRREYAKRQQRAN